MSTNGLVRRINRALAEQGLHLRKARSARTRRERGQYYVVTEKRSCVLDTGIDPERYARAIGVRVED